MRLHSLLQCHLAVSGVAAAGMSWRHRLIELLLGNIDDSFLGTLDTAQLLSNAIWLQVGWMKQGLLEWAHHITPQQGMSCTALQACLEALSLHTSPPLISCSLTLTSLLFLSPLLLSYLLCSSPFLSLTSLVVIPVLLFSLFLHISLNSAAFLCCC